MKICIFTETYYPVVGGGEIQAQILAEGLIRQGHSVMVLTRRSDAALRAHETYGGVNIYRVGFPGRGQWQKWSLLFLSLPTLIRLGHDFDLIFVAGYRIIGLSAVLIGKLFRKPVVLKADSQGEMSGEYFRAGLKQAGISSSSFLFRLFLHFRNNLLKQAQAFSAISAEIASEWAANGVPSNKIHLIPNSVDTRRFAPVTPIQKQLLREQFNLPRSATIAIYSGRLVSYKGLPLLLKVWNEIRCKHANILLILAGTGGFDIHNCEEDLRTYVKSSELEKHVLFTGAVVNIDEYLQASDLFIFPTENEAFGASLIEAMSCGLPVITTPLGAIKDIVSDRDNGLLVQPGDFAKLYEAIDVMLSNKELASELGKSARKSVQGRYAVETVTHMYLALFQSIVPHPRSEDL